MPLRKDVAKDIAKKRYLDALKALPDLRGKKARTYVELTLTLVTLIVLGLFAINPTLSTITELKKEIEDSTFVNQSLTQKISSLSQLQQLYTQLTPDLPRVMAAIPDQPDTPHLMGQLQTIAENNNVTISSFQSSAVEIIQKSLSPLRNDFSYTVTINAEGTYNNIERFLGQVSTFDRIVSIEALTISVNPKNKSTLLISMRLRTYFKPSL